MRELSLDEMMLVAGGTATDFPQEGEREGEEDHWWNEAYQWLSESLGWLGEATGGWLGDYIGGFGEVAEGMGENGDLLWDRAKGYNDYCIDQQSNGKECVPFDQWVNGGG